MSQGLRWKLTRLAGVILALGIILYLSNPNPQEHMYELNPNGWKQFTYGEPREWSSEKYIGSPGSCSAGWAKKGWKIEYRDYGLFSTAVRLGGKGEKLLTVGALYVVVDMRK